MISIVVFVQSKYNFYNTYQAIKYCVNKQLQVSFELILSDAFCYDW